MSWAQPRGADRDKLNDIAPIWTSLLVCSVVVRCKLLPPGRFQCQDTWRKNKRSKNMNFSSQLKYECIMKHKEWRQGTRHFPMFVYEVSTEWTLGDLWQIYCHSIDQPQRWEKGVRRCIVQLHDFKQLLNSYRSLNWWGQ
jgi:hypothetical protein